MPKRKSALVSGEVYHTFNKSIFGFKIFNTDTEYSRMMTTLRYYQRENPPCKLYLFNELRKQGVDYIDGTIGPQFGEKLVEIICYCLMPTHLHLILKQLKEPGITSFMRRILNSYSHYFNKKRNRKGPLWEGRFKSVLVKTDEQLLHLTRYIHLNPVTARLVDKPEDWPASSYREYMSMVNGEDKICRWEDLLKVEPGSYRRFVEDRISYQRDLAKIKGLLFD